MDNKESNLTESLRRLQYAKKRTSHFNNDEEKKDLERAIRSLQNSKIKIASTPMPKRLSVTKKSSHLPANSSQETSPFNKVCKNVGLAPKVLTNKNFFNISKKLKNLNPDNLKSILDVKHGDTSSISTKAAYNTSNSEKSHNVNEKQQSPAIVVPNIALSKTSSLLPNLSSPIKTVNMSHKSATSKRVSCQLISIAPGCFDNETIDVEGSNKFIRQKTYQSMRTVGRYRSNSVIQSNDKFGPFSSNSSKSLIPEDSKMTQRMKDIKMQINAGQNKVSDILYRLKCSQVENEASLKEFSTNLRIKKIREER